MLKSLKKIRKFPSFLTWFFFIILKLYSLLIFKKRIDPNSYIDIKKFPYITVTWHNRILFFPIMFPKKIRKHTCAVISASRDGQYLADLVSLFGVKPIRGSTKKNALSALNNSLREIRKGKNVCYTPDGPRGPVCQMSRGPIITASKTGRPILPISINYSKYWELKTWDKFRIPKPFSTVTLIVGEPIKIPAELTDDEIEKWRLIIQEKLNSIS